MFNAYKSVQNKLPPTHTEEIMSVVNFCESFVFYDV